MAKKKAAKKSAPKKSAKVVKMKPKAKTAAKPVTRTSSPRSQTLPGMEQVRNRSLDRICENISDVRLDKNRLVGEEKDLMNQAVRVMQGDKVTVYRFHGVELVLVPGDVRLRVRTLKDAPANAEPEGPADGQATGVTLDEMTEELPDDERLAEQEE